MDLVGGGMEGENGKAVRLIRRFQAGLGDARGLWQRDNIFIFWVLLWSPVAGQQGAWEWERTAGSGDRDSAKVR